MHSHHAESEVLGREITALCGHLYAATYRLLELIREFDEKGGWAQPGLVSCAHWLNFKCGIGLHAAREKVRVARALKDLPAIGEALRKGEVSYSKVRAMTRIADSSNEAYLLMIARHGTACHVERLVSQYRRCERARETEAANERQARRALDYYYDHDDCLVVRARLPAETGALVVKALESAMAHDDSIDRAAGETEPGAADRVNDIPGISYAIPNFAARRADALAVMAEHYLDSPPRGQARVSSADRYQVVLHVSADVLRDVPAGTPAEAQTDGPAGTSDAALIEWPPGSPPDPSTGSPADSSAGPSNAATGPSVPLERHELLGRSHLENGPRVPAETARRLACDAAIVPLLVDGRGEPLSIGRKSRSVTAAIRRAMRARDGGCRFPGCINGHYLDAHHIDPWGGGGETGLINLVQLCRHHHRLVHEGGFTCERQSDGRIVFRDPSGREVTAPEVPETAVDPVDEVAWFEEYLADVDIDADTCVTRWEGERIDWDLAVSHLFQ